MFHNCLFLLDFVKIPTTLNVVWYLLPDDVDHIHTGLERQVTTVDLEVLKDPKVEIKVLNLTHNNNVDQVSRQFLLIF